VRLALNGCTRYREDGKQEAEGSVVVANDAERPLTAHRRTASRPMDDMSIRGSLSGSAQRDAAEELGSPNSKKDK